MNPFSYIRNLFTNISSNISKLWQNTINLPRFLFQQGLQLVSKAMTSCLQLARYIFAYTSKREDRINEGNICVFVLLFCTASKLLSDTIDNWPEAITIIATMYMIFLFVKTEHSSLSAKDALDKITELLSKTDKTNKIDKIDKEDKSNAK